jgi:hypothetical protein
MNKSITYRRQGLAKWLSRCSPVDLIGGSVLAFWVVLLGAIGLTGCGDTPPAEPEIMLQKQTPAPVVELPGPGNRFHVERAAVFTDDLAYGSRRGIYLLTDAVTGRQYVGISGVGIAELRREGKQDTEH